MAFETRFVMTPIESARDALATLVTNEALAKRLHEGRQSGL
jgi:hypothetical protein